MKLRTFLAMAAIILLLPLSTYAAPSNHQDSTQVDKTQVAQFFSGRGGNRKGERMQKLLQQLDLTPEQSTQIESIHEQYHTANQQNYQQLQQARAEMRSLFAQDANPNQLRQKHQEIQNLHQQLGNNRFEATLQVREILTSQQRQKMAELIAQHRGRRGHHQENSF